FDAYAMGWSSNGGSACGAAPRPTSVSQVFHFLLVKVSGTQVTVTPIDSLGNKFDAKTYTFSAATVQQSNPSTNLGSDRTPPRTPPRRRRPLHRWARRPT